MNFVNGEKGLDHYITFTYIFLIPKVNNPSIVSEYGPISLCNVFYKLVSKVLANILKKVLCHIISSNQSTFIPKRLIIDNNIIAYEALYNMRTKQKRKSGNVTLKPDISKANYIIEWKYL